MKKMGLIYVCRINDVPHALVFERGPKLNTLRVKIYEFFSKLIGSLINSSADIFYLIKFFLKN
jgi:hypothetical protein